MIIGPVLGGCYLAAYYAVGTTVTPPEPPVVSAVAAQPGGAWRSRGRPRIEDTTHSTPRFKGSRQTFEDGVYRDTEETLEEVGTKKPTPEEPTVAEVVEALTAPQAPPKQGQEAIAAGIVLPSLPPVPVFHREPDLGAQALKRKRDIAQFNAAVLARLLPELCEW